MGANTTVVIPEELFEGAGSSPYSGFLELDELEVGPDTLRFREPLPWNLTVMTTGEGSFMVSGSVGGAATVACARCLEEFELDLDGEVEGFLFLDDPGDDLPEGIDEDEYLVVGENHAVDVADLLKAALVLAVPLVPLHDEDCMGLCPRCGHNLNLGPCECGDADDGFSPENPFAALKDFRFDG